MSLRHICELVHFGGIKCAAGKQNSSGITERSGECRRLIFGRAEILATPEQNWASRTVRTSTRIRPCHDKSKRMSNDYFGWDPYWGGSFLPMSNAMATPFVAPLYEQEFYPA